MEAAVSYAGRGLLVFPLHSPHQGGCSCGKPECASPAKHPRTPNGLRDGTTDENTVMAWWSRWRNANIGIVTGAASGLVVLDIDVQHGGQRSLAELEAEHEKLAATPEVLTGGGGKHLYFRHPGETVGNSAGRLGAGLDIRGDGGYVVAPPSLHASGRPYKWLRPGRKLELDEPPAWLLAQATRRRNGPVPKIDMLIPAGRRNDELASLAGSFRRRGMNENEILAALEAVNWERCKPPLPAGELEGIAASMVRYEPAGELGKPAYDGPARELTDVLETFRSWLYLPDPAPVYVTCAAIAANRVERFDPTWLVLIGAAGSGKTEALNAATGLAGVYLAGTLTEASLLSGTPRKDTADGASGGLLHEIGTSGILILKDFGSILSMHREQRANVLAALREIYDGSWHRDVGSDGGRRLHWEGRIGLLAGATTVLDSHHAVMAQLGERFLLHRIAVPDPRSQGKASLAHHGRERTMRRELADAITGLFADLDVKEPPALTESDSARLVDLADLVSRGRSPVIRDNYRREIELVPDSEAPGRIVGALARVLTGLRLIGVDEREAWRLTSKTGLDSMPAARLQALEFLLGRDEATTSDVATELDLPTQTTRRTLEDLAAHGLIARESQGQGKPDLWRIQPWTAERHRAATTVPEMSVSPI